MKLSLLINYFSTLFYLFALQLYGISASKSRAICPLSYEYELANAR